MEYLLLLDDLERRFRGFNVANANSAVDNCNMDAIGIGKVS